jgi:hypothetical protein
MSLRDRLSKIAGKTRYVVSRIFIHLSGDEVAPLLGVLNQAARNAVDSEGDMGVLGEGLVDICQSLLNLKYYWQSAANEGDVFWQEEEAGDYVNELFTDSAQRYGSGLELSEPLGENDPLTLPLTHNLVVMITVAFEGENQDIETNLADREALEYALKALISLHYQGALPAIQVHFSPAQLGDELTSEQILENYPELLPL